MLKIGSFTQPVPKNTQLFVEGQEDFSIYKVVDGEPVAMIARSQDRHCKFTLREDMEIKVVIVGNKFVSLDARPVKSEFEEVSPIPYEVPDDNAANLTLEEKLKRYLAEMVAERYGEESDEMDTFDDAQDLDWEDEDPLAQFEPKPVIEEEILPADPPPEPPPEPDPAPDPESPPP